MKFKTFLGYVLGVFVIITGFYCLFNPSQTYLTLGYAVGISMLIDGCALLYFWFEEKKAGEKDFWTFLGGLVSVACGIFIIVDEVAQLSVDVFIAYFAASWIIVRGLMSLILSFKVRKMHKQYNTSILGSRWYYRTLTGILILIFGILAIMNPVIITTSIGLFIGLGIISCGLDIIAATHDTYEVYKFTQEIKNTASDIIETVKAAVEPEKVDAEPEEEAE